MAKSFPSGEDLGEASSPASTPYTLHPPLYKNRPKAIFICFSPKIIVPLHRKGQSTTIAAGSDSVKKRRHIIY
jgi:hypothetical protein